MKGDSIFHFVFFLRLLNVFTVRGENVNGVFIPGEMFPIYVVGNGIRYFEL